MAFKKGENTYQKRKRTKIYLKITPQIIADAKGVTVGAIHKAKLRGVLDMTDLKSIACYLSKGEEN